MALPTLVRSKLRLIRKQGNPSRSSYGCPRLSLRSEPHRVLELAPAASQELVELVELAAVAEDNPSQLAVVAVAVGRNLDWAQVMAPVPAPELHRVHQHRHFASSFVLV